MLSHQIKSTDAAIDRLVYALPLLGMRYRLMEEEIKNVESYYSFE